MSQGAARAAEECETAREILEVQREETPPAGRAGAGPVKWRDELAWKFAIAFCCDRLPRVNACRPCALSSSNFDVKSGRESAAVPRQGGSAGKMRRGGTIWVAALAVLCLARLAEGDERNQRYVEGDEVRPNTVRCAERCNPARPCHAGCSGRCDSSPECSPRRAPYAVARGESTMRSLLRSVCGTPRLLFVRRKLRGASSLSGK